MADFSGRQNQPGCGKKRIGGCCVRIRAGISVRVRIRDGVRISNIVRRRVKLVNYSLITALPIATSADPHIRFLPVVKSANFVDRLTSTLRSLSFRVSCYRVRLSVRNIEYITQCFTVTRYCVTSCNIKVNLTVQMDTFRYKYRIVLAKNITNNKKTSSEVE